MAASDHLNPQQFTARDGAEYSLSYRTEDQGERKPRHVVEAHQGDQRVGALNWYGTTGVVGRIEVDPDHTRKGIATAMWDHAQSLPGVKKPKQSNDRTRQGEAWAKSIKGRGSKH